MNRQRYHLAQHSDPGRGPAYWYIYDIQTAAPLLMRYTDRRGAEKALAATRGTEVRTARKETAR